jgi:hypothetical protein
VEDCLQIWFTGDERKAWAIFNIGCGRQKYCESKTEKLPKAKLARCITRYKKEEENSKRVFMYGQSSFSAKL